MLYFPQTGEMVGSGGGGGKHGTKHRVPLLCCSKELSLFSCCALLPPPRPPPFAGIVVHLKVIAIGTWHRVVCFVEDHLLFCSFTWCLLSGVRLRTI